MYTMYRMRHVFKHIGYFFAKVNFRERLVSTNVVYILCD